MQFKLAQASEFDKPFLLNLRKSTMVEHLEKAGLFLSEQQHVERVAEEFEHSFLIKSDNTTVGLLKFITDTQKIFIAHIQVAPEYQGKGLGKAVISHIIDNAIAQNKPVELTVLKANPAKDLYLRLGFEIYGEDKYEFHMRHTSQPINK